MKKLVSLIIFSLLLVVGIVYANISSCLSPQYEWRTNGRDFQIQFPNDETVRVHIATGKEVQTLESGLLPGETWLIINTPNSPESGAILEEGGIFFLQRSENGISQGYALTVCGGLIWYAPLPPEPTPPMENGTPFPNQEFFNT